MYKLIFFFEEWDVGNPIISLIFSEFAKNFPGTFLEMYQKHCWQYP